MGRATRNVVSLKNKFKNEPLTIIIPAAGEGTRMKSYGPKSLIKINGFTLLDYQVKLLRQFYAEATIIVVSGYESTKIMNNAPDNIIHVENERYKETNVVRSIAIGLRATITPRVLIVYGDLLFNADTLKYPLEDKSLLFIDTSNTMTEDEVGCTIIDECVENVLYDLPNKWAQIMYLFGKELKLLQQIVYNPANEKLLGFEAINGVINKGGVFHAATPTNIKVNDIDCSKDLLKIPEII